MQLPEIADAFSAFTTERPRVHLVFSLFKVLMSFA